MTSLGTTSVSAIPDSRIARDATDLIRSVESDLLYHPLTARVLVGALQGALRRALLRSRISNKARETSAPLGDRPHQAAVSRCGSFQPGRGKWQV
jgi:hypothetical protein